MLYILIGILMFGAIVVTHELGHFVTAKGLGVRVNEFSIGMGPALFSWERGDTLYSLRLLPFGGYCAMEGDDEDSDDPRAFGRAASWKKLIILSAGAGMNFLTGLLILFCLTLPSQGFTVPNIAGFLEGYGIESCGLQAGDIVRAVDGHRVYSYSNLSFFLSRAGDTMDWVVERNGEIVTVRDMHIPLQERTDEEGNTTWLRGLSIGWTVLPPTVGNKLLFTWYDATDLVRTVWISLGDIVTGAVGLRDLSGPVGIVNVVSEVGEEAARESVWDAVYWIAWLAALIAVNMAVMNLLPLPALDGGRIFFLLLNGVLHILIRKKIPSRFESYVHAAGLLALLMLMLLVTLSDVGKLFGK